MGSGNEGEGARVTAEFDLTAGDELVMVVGQQGDNKSCSDWGAGGGGGTYVTKHTWGGDTIAPLSIQVQPLVIAGGGAGMPDDNWGCHYSAKGGQGLEGDGEGGTGGPAGGGGGYYSDGVGTRPGRGFLHGASGYDATYDGGFGGGSGPYDGAGSDSGWSGGSNQDGNGPGGGGTSYSAGSNTTVQTDTNSGAGEVTIWLL